MSKIDLSLGDVYRASDVKRWGIVKVAKEQSVAEHSYQVAMITARLCQLHGLGGEKTQRAVWYALTHDLPEVLTGDIATPLKDFLGADTRSRLKEFEERVTVAGRETQCDDPEIVDIVKTADIIEAIAFLRQNALTLHGTQIQASMMNKIKSKGCPHANAAMVEVLTGSLTTLNSVMGETQ